MSTSMEVSGGSAALAADLAEPCDVPLGCHCGTVRAVAWSVSPQCANRVVCYCKYCEAHAYDLGCAERVLDALGGSERFQVSPAALELTQGIEQISCRSLTSWGGLRWYAACCGTPVAMTLRVRSVPFLAIDRCFVDDSTMSRPLDVVVGPIRARVNSRFPRAERAEMKATPGALLSMLWHFAPLLAGWWWRGDRRRGPFFDAETGAPLAPVEQVASEWLPVIAARRVDERRRSRALPSPRGSG